MSSGLFDDPHLDAAWRAYAEQDRRLTPPPELEQRTLARCLGASVTTGRRLPRRRWLAVVAGLSAAASIAIAAYLTWPQTEPRSRQPFAAPNPSIAALPATVEAERPRVAAASVIHPGAPPMFEAYVQHVELPEALVQFDSAPLQVHEPLQMVRLRLPLEALQALGLALFEAGASGVVDVDVIIGEDGLPRDIRQVRIGQEQR